MANNPNDYRRKHTTKNGHSVGVEIERDKEGNVPGVKNKGTSDLIVSVVDFLFDIFSNKKGKNN